MGLLSDGPHRILVPSRTYVHSLFGCGISVGAVLLFLVFASVTGMESSPGGDRAPGMAASSAVILASVGAILLGLGLWLRRVCEFYTVFDLRQKRLLRLERIFGRVIQETLVTGLDQIGQFGVQTRAVTVSADLVLAMLTGMFRRADPDAPSPLLTKDYALIGLGKDGTSHEITHFVNGSSAAQLAQARARFLGECLGLPNAEEPLELGEKQESRPEAVAKWAILVGFLVGMTILLMNASK